MRTGQGFTLIELMVVVAIMGILLAIAVPQYSQYVLKAKLTDASSQLSDLRVRMEQYFQDNKSYVDAGGDCGVAMPSGSQITYFSFACAADADTFSLTATSTASLGAVGDYVYTLNESNTKSTTAFEGASGLPKSCWITSAGGSC